MNKISLTLLGAVIFGSALPAMAEPDWQAIKLGHQYKREKMFLANADAQQSNGSTEQRTSDRDARMADMMKQCDQMMKNK